MRLGIPPTLKFSALIDTNNLSPKSSIFYPSSQHKSGIKINSKAFTQDGDSQLGQNVGVNDLMSLQSKFSNIRLLSPVNGGTHEKKSIESTGKSMLPEMRIQQSAKGRLDKQGYLKEKLLSPSKSKNLKLRNSQNSSPTVPKESSQDSLRNTIKSLNVIEVINEEQSFSLQNSLKSSLRIHKKASLPSKFGRNTDLRNDLKDSRIRQSTEEFDKHINTGWQPPVSRFDSNEWPVIFQKQIEHIRKKSNIEIDEVESAQSVSPLNTSQESCQTVNIVQVIDGIREIQQNKSLNYLQSKEQNTVKVVNKLLQNEKQLKINDRHSMQNDIEIGKSINSVIHSNNKSELCNSIKDEQKKLLNGISERFKKMKEIKNGPQQNNKEIQTLNILSSHISIPSKNQSSLQLKNRVFSQKGTQTDSVRSQPISQPNFRQMLKKYTDQITILQKQISKLSKELSTYKDSYSRLETFNEQIKQENHLLIQRAKRLERKLQKNESELLEWKQCVKERQRECQQNEKVNSVFKEKNEQWKHREERYINQVAELQRELHRTNYLLRTGGDRQESSIQETAKVFKENKNYQKHMQRLQQYEQNIAHNMEIVKRQQQKIINQWRMIDRFYTNTNMKQRNQENQSVQPKRTLNTCTKVSSLQFSDQNVNDNDLVSLSAKVKAMRSQLTKEPK